MKFLESAFAQLAFAWKLYDYALEGEIDLDKLDRAITFRDATMVFVLPDKIFTGYEELVLACSNNLSVSFGAAAITFDRAREEFGIKLPDPIESESDQCVALLYQIRNAFAHDISEPKWHLRNPRYARVYEFGGMRVDLTNKHNEPFRYEDLGGPDTLFQMRRFALQNIF